MPSVALLCSVNRALSSLEVLHAGHRALSRGNRRSFEASLFSWSISVYRRGVAIYIQCTSGSVGRPIKAFLKFIPAESTPSFEKHQKNGILSLAIWRGYRYYNLWNVRWNFFTSSLVFRSTRINCTKRQLKSSKGREKSFRKYHPGRWSSESEREREKEASLITV